MPTITIKNNSAISHVALWATSNYGIRSDQGGADASGRYSTPPGYSPVPKTGPLNGVNFGIDAGVTVNF